MKILLITGDTSCDRYHTSGQNHRKSSR